MTKIAIVLLVAACADQPCPSALPSNTDVCGLAPQRTAYGASYALDAAGFNRVTLLASQFDAQIRWEDTMQSWVMCMGLDINSTWNGGSAQ